MNESVSALFPAVSNALWMQREALEMLLYRLMAEQLVVSSGSTRFLVRADADVQAAIHDVQGGELVRAAETDALLRELGLPAEASLAEIADAAPEPWSTLLDEHRTALRTLSFEVQAAADENHRLLDAGARAVHETLAGLGSAVSGYDDTGHAVRRRSAALLFDEQA